MAVLKLLGGALVEDEDGATLELTSRRHPLAVLALLATAPSRTLSRGKLVGLLWPDSPEEKARNRLNTCLHNIRRALGGGAVVSIGDEIRLDPGALDCDVCRFEEALAAGERETAVGLYGGPFLDGFYLEDSAAFEQRVDRTAARLRRAYLDALEGLAVEAGKRQDHRAAAEWWSRLAEEDPYDARIACRLMRALATSGNRAAALRHARLHARRLDEDLGMAPSAAVRTLADRLETEADAEEVGSEGETEAEAVPTEAAKTAPTEATEAAPTEAAKAAPTGAAETAEVGGAERDSEAAEVAAAERDGEGGTVGAPPAPGGERDGPPAGPRPRSATRRRGDRPGARQLRTGLQLLLGLGVLAAAGVGVWYLLGSNGRMSAPSSVGRTLAVLPFENLSEGTSPGFAAGLHEGLVTRLSNIPTLQVVSPTTVRRLQETDEPLPAAAGRLGIAWVVRAGVQEVEGRVRVEARLIDARRDAHVWARDYERELTAHGLFEIQGEIAREIADALEAHLSPEAARRLAAVPTENTAAYELYLQAREPPAAGRFQEDVDQDARLYGRAVELDPAFAEAWAGLGHAYVRRLWLTQDTAWADSAEAAVDRALELDPDLAAAYAVRGDILSSTSRPVEEAIAAYRKALDLRPSFPRALNNFIVLLVSEGRLAEAVRWKERAYRLSPASSDFIGALASLNSALGRDDVADAWLDEARARGLPMADAAFEIALFHRGDPARARELLTRLPAEEGPRASEVFMTRRRAAVDLYEGRWRDARREYRTLFPGVPTSSSPIYKGLLADPVGFAFALDRLREREEIRAIARQVADSAEAQIAAGAPGYYHRHRAAVAHLLLGDTAEAVQWLERGVDRGFRDGRTMRTVPTLAPLLGHPGFEALLARVDSLVTIERRRVETEGTGLPGR